MGRGEWVMDGWVLLGEVLFRKLFLFHEYFMIGKCDKEKT